jgi:hypothetical protein
MISSYQVVQAAHTAPLTPHSLLHLSHPAWTYLSLTLLPTYIYPTSTPPHAPPALLSCCIAAYIVYLPPFDCRPDCQLYEAGPLSIFLHFININLFIHLYFLPTASRCCWPRHIYLSHQSPHPQPDSLQPWPGPPLTHPSFEINNPLWSPAHATPTILPFPLLQNIPLYNILFKLISILTPPSTTPLISIPSPSHPSYVLFSNHPSLPYFSSLFSLSKPIFTNNSILLILFYPHYPFILFFPLPIITMFITTFYC